MGSTTDGSVSRNKNTEGEGMNDGRFILRHKET